MSKHQKQTNDSGTSDAASDEAIVKMTIVSPLAPSEIVILYNHCWQWQEFGQNTFMFRCVRMPIALLIQNIFWSRVAEWKCQNQMNWYLTNSAPAN